MRIISDFKDYYDRYEGGEPVYVRKTRELRDVPFLEQLSDRVRALRSEYKSIRVGRIWPMHHIEPKLLAFCGRLYVWYEDIETKHIIRTQDVLMDYIGERSKGYWARERAASGQAWKELQLADVSAFNHEHGSPIVLSERIGYSWFHLERSRTRRLLVNATIDPQLKPLGFSHYMGADQCHQEIEMFVGGVLAAGDSSDRTPTDREKIVSHGMDPKWSFRNPLPPKRKRK